MNKILLFLFLCSANLVLAQKGDWYVAAKAGLNIREKPELGAKLLGKIPYGEKISLTDNNEDARTVATEGMSGYWRKVSYDNKTGYIIDCYLFPVPPPKKETKTLKEYLAQLSPAFGKELIVKGGDLENPEEAGTETTKQLYTNGAEWHGFQAPEYSSATGFILGFTMQQGFLLVRMLPEFADVFTEKEEFPVKDKTYKKNGETYRIKIDKEMISNTPWVKRITVEFEPAAIYTFELFQIDNQLVIFYGSGV